MPIQKTKLVMSKAQATGMLDPQTPTPVEIKYVAASDAGPQRVAPQECAATTTMVGVLANRQPMVSVILGNCGGRVRPMESVPDRSIRDRR